MPAATQRLWNGVGSGSLADLPLPYVLATVRFYGEVLPSSGPQFVNQRQVIETRQQVDEEQFGPIVGHQILTRYLTVEQRLGRLDGNIDTAMLAVVLLGSCQQYAFLSLTRNPRPT